MVSTRCAPGDVECQIVIRPDRSLTWGQSLAFLGVMAFTLGLISLGFFVMGYWVVLPFAGLELALLVWCSWWVARCGMRCEVVSLNADEVRIEKGLSGCSGRGRPIDAVTYPRAWARVELREGAGWYPKRLLLGASGIWTELGSFLAEGEKRRLARRLNRLLVPASVA